MFRRTPHRAISQYNFGQPSLTRAFGPIPRERQLSKLDEIKSTKLPNGIRIISRDRDGPHSVFGIYVDAGPKYDPLTSPGLSHVMRYAIQTSNMDSSLFQLDRTMRSTGNAYGHSEINKRYLNWKAEGRRDMWERPFTLMTTGVVAPRFHESDIERFRDTMDNQREELRWQHPRHFCINALENIAFFKEPLGSYRMVPPLGNDTCTQTILVNHWATYFHPNNITVAAVNISHDALIAAYESLPYSHSAEAPHHLNCKPPTFSHSSEVTQFYPGKQEILHEDRAKVMGTVPDMQEEIIAAVGVPIYGAEEDIKKYATALVTQEIYQSTLDQMGPAAFSETHGIQTFYRPYSSAGLIGFTLRGAPGEVDNLLEIATANFPSKISQEDITAGRAQAAITFKGNHLEMVRDYCDFLATSRFTETELMEAIEKVTQNDVEAALASASAVAPAVFVTGSTFNFPKISSLKKIK